MKRTLFPKNLEEAIDSGDDFEESYEKLFPKIGRDFVYREDLVEILNRISVLIDPFGIYGIGELGKTYAISRALTYKDNIEAGLPNQYRDLIRLDE